ncbi:MAG: lamin tail domain-containing protein [Candidatus Woesearchaeota archaeon]
MAFGQVYISAILYDPPGPDLGNEWIELYNPTNSTQDLTEYQLFTSNARTDWNEIPLEGHIPPQSYFLIGEENITADVIRPLRLVNVRGAVKFGRDSFHIIGWGDVDNETFYQEHPALPARDRPLVRKNDTYSNLESYKPVLHYSPSNSFTQIQDTNLTKVKELDAFFHIPNVPPSISVDHILSHQTENGKVIYYPTRNQNLTIRVRIEDKNSLKDVQEIRIQYDNTTLAIPLRYNTTQTQTQKIINIPLQTHMVSQNITVTVFDSHTYATTMIPLQVISTVGIHIAEERVDFHKSNEFFTTTLTITNTGSTSIHLTFDNPVLKKTNTTLTLVQNSHTHSIKPQYTKDIILITQSPSNLSQGVYPAQFRLRVEPE